MNATAPEGFLPEPPAFATDRAPGEHRAPCPECSGGRPGDDALSYRFDSDGAGTFFCHRCHDGGAWSAPRVNGDLNPPDFEGWRAPSPESRVALMRSLDCASALRR